MKLKEFAKSCGITVGVDCSGGFYYRNIDAEHITFSGWKTETRAYEGWLMEEFSPAMRKGIRKLLKDSEK